MFVVNKVQKDDIVLNFVSNHVQKFNCSIDDSMLMENLLYAL